MKIAIQKREVSKNGKIGFLFSTYDEMDFLWPDFFRLLMKFWPGFDTYFDSYISMCENKSIYVSDRLTIEPGGLSNSEYSYSERLQNCINRLDCEFVFIILDDYFIKSLVDLQRLAETVSLLTRDTTIDYIEYENFRTKVTKEKEELDFLARLQNRMFLCNLQISLWRARSLSKVLRLKENAWFFEYYGSVRAILYKFRVLTIKKGERPIFDYDFGWLVQRGRFHKPTYSSYVETLSIDPEMFQKIGFYDKEDRPKKKGLRIVHFFKALASFFAE